MGDYYDRREPAISVRIERTKAQKTRTFLLFTLILILIAIAGIAFLENTILVFQSSMR